MTLADWCRTYVYMPAIGITRRPYVAVYASFLAIGLWHGGALSYANDAAPHQHTGPRGRFVIRHWQLTSEWTSERTSTCLR